MGLIVGLGAAAGLIVAAACALFYLKGVRDGMDVKKGRKPRIAGKIGTGGSDEAQSEIGKKFEAILSYDPYETDKQREQRGGV